MALEPDGEGADGRATMVFGAVVRAGLNSAPFTGGIASLWSEWDTGRRFQRVEQAIREFGERLAAHQAAFDPMKLGDAEMHLLEDALHRVSREHREAKRRHFVALMVSHWIHTDYSFEQRLLFNRALDEFGDEHLRILRYLMQETEAGSATLPKGDELRDTVFPEGARGEFSRQVFIPAVNKLAGGYGFVLRTAIEGGIMFNVNPDGLALTAHFAISTLGQRFIHSLDHLATTARDVPSEQFKKRSGTCEHG